MQILGGTGVGQIRYLNRALMRFDSKVSISSSRASRPVNDTLQIVIPSQFVLFNLSAIVGSAILYGDFRKATFHQMASGQIHISGPSALLTTFSRLPFSTAAERPLLESSLLHGRQAKLATVATNPRKTKIPRCRSRHLNGVAAWRNRGHAVDATTQR